MLVLPNLRQQDNFSCGVVVARVVLRYLGLKYSHKTLFSRLLCSADEGVEVRNISTFMRHEGLHVCDGQMSMDDLRHFTGSRKIPVICLVTFPFLGTGGHYVAVAGVGRSFVHYHDPSMGPQKMRIGEFKASWMCDSALNGANYKAWGVASWNPLDDQA